jgi:ankyrin repeat protein
MNTYRADQPFTSLLEAARLGQWDRVQQLLRLGTDVNSRSSQDLTLLHVAAGEGSPVLCQQLLGQGARIDQPTKRGDTPLHYALLGGHEPVVNLLMAAGAQVHHRNFAGWTALHVAALAGLNGSAALLLGQGADPEAEDHFGRRPLHYAALKNSLSVCRVLFEAGAGLNPVDQLGCTPWHYVEDLFRLKNKEALDFFFQAGAHYSPGGGRNQYWEDQAQRKDLAYCRSVVSGKVNLQAPWPDTPPPHQAAGEGHWASLMLMLDRGVSVDVPDSHSYTPLMHAISSKKIQTCRFLLAQGADSNAKGRGGKTPLLISIRQKPFVDVASMLRFRTPTDQINRVVHQVMSEHLAACYLLLEKGADVNLYDEEGNTPLHLAIEHGYPDIAELLLEKGADVQAKNPKGLTLLQASFWKGGGVVFEQLLARGASINDPAPPFEETLLYQTVRRRMPYFIVSNLLEHGADPTIWPAGQYSPLQYAVSGGEVETCKLLAAYGANLHEVDKWGYGLLHQLASCTHLGEESLLAMAEFLLSQKVAPGLQCSQGLTALDVARQNGNHVIIRLLEARS